MHIAIFAIALCDAIYRFKSQDSGNKAEKDESINKMLSSCYWHIETKYGIIVTLVDSRDWADGANKHSLFFVCN